MDAKLGQLERAHELSDDAGQQRRHRRRLTHEHRRERGERRHVAKEEDRVGPRQPSHHLKVARQQLVHQSVWRLAASAVAVAVAVTVAGAVVATRVVGGHGGGGEGPCGHRSGRHPRSRQVWQVRRHQAKVGGGEAVGAEGEVDAAAVPRQMTQHRTEAAEGDRALHRRCVAHGQHAIKRRRERCVAAVGGEPPEDDAAHIQALERRRRLRRFLGAAVVAAACCAAQLLVGRHGLPVVLHHLEERGHLGPRPQVGEKVGGALVRAARRGEGLPEVLDARAPVGAALHRVVRSDEEVTGALTRPRRPRTARARAHLDADAVGRLACTLLERNRAAVAHAVDHQPRVQRRVGRGAVGGVAAAAVAVVGGGRWLLPQRQLDAVGKDGDASHRRALEHQPTRLLEARAHALEQRGRRDADVEHAAQLQLEAALARRPPEAARHRPEAQWRDLGELRGVEHADRDELAQLLLRRVPVLRAAAERTGLDDRDAVALSLEGAREQQPERAAADGDVDGGDSGARGGRACRRRARLDEARRCLRRPLGEVQAAQRGVLRGEAVEERRAAGAAHLHGGWERGEGLGGQWAREVVNAHRSARSLGDVWSGVCSIGVGGGKFCR